jgi:hypothetical protein
MASIGFRWLSFPELDTPARSMKTGNKKFFVMA